MIAVNGLYKHFGEKPVLRGIDCHVKKGEVLVLIGPSGSGKSSLLRCIGGLEPFQEGSVQVGKTRVSGTAFKKMSKSETETLRQLRIKVGMVFQQFHLFPHMTVLGNIVEAPMRVLKLSENQAVARAQEVLAKVKMTAFMNRFPASLSGGEQQRVAIARTLAMEPECVLFDEPTSSLDPETVGDVLAVMRFLASEGMTLLVVTHEMSFAREVADRILMLDEGKIIESGSAEEIFQQPKQDRTRTFLQRILNR
ncbi:MAG: amino acid ABC transporter ATP-binding protein [Nitrospinae bacterium]|jgi:ABC-type polar amino acid transport system ATPase subunit|nr:amino acid ABC transporter ATP-binding protein [Nitrospinota bacterium]MDA1110221.1 amino acid ABC transporter ATP-binding protein [Nitrospinota bacterium]